MNRRPLNLFALVALLVVCQASAALRADAFQGWASAPTQDPHAERARTVVPRQLLSAARTLYINSETDFLHDSKLEQALQSRKEFDKLGLAVTRTKGDADLVIEVHRSSFTTHFDYSIIDPDSERVLASGAVNSLFGTASGKIASQVLKKLGDARRLGTP